MQCHQAIQLALLHVVFFKQSYLIIMYEHHFNALVVAQWLSGRVLDSGPRDHGFEPHWCHWVVVLEQDLYPSLVLAQPRKTHPL